MLGQAHDDAVVAPDHLDVAAEVLLQLGPDRHCPRCVDLGSERCVDADPPVADLVAEALDDDRAVIGDGPGGVGLLVEVVEQVLRSQGVEADLVDQPWQRIPVLAQLPHELTHRLAELEGSAGSVAMPERHLAGLARGRRDDDPLEGDLLDTPARGAEQEHFARPALVDHLLVELTDPGAVGQEHAEQPSVGDRARVGHRQPLRSLAPSELALDPVPHDAGSQFGELLARIPTGEQVEHVVEDVVAELGEVRRATYHRCEPVDRPVVHRAHGDDLLGQHVEGVAEEVRRLDEPASHAVRDDRSFEQVGPVLGEQLAPADVTDVVAGPPDALQPAADRTGGLDLDHEIDRAHVDAQLERARGDESLERALLELVFDHETLLSRDRTVVGLHEGRDLAFGIGQRRGGRCQDGIEPFPLESPLVGELVHSVGEPLGESPVVDEDQRGLVGLDEVEQPWVDRRPDALADRTGGCGSTDRFVDDASEVAHVLDRYDDLEVERLSDSGIDDGDGTPGISVVTSEEPSGLLERALGGGQADALWRASAERFEPFEGQ